MTTLGHIVLSDASDLLRSVEEGSVSVIVTDPPYGIAYHSNHYVDKNPHAPIAHDWNFQIGSFLDLSERALKDGGALYLFSRWDVYPLWAKEIPPSLSLKNLIVWDKGNWSSGDLTGNFGFQYEVILFLTKGRHKLREKRWPNIWSAPRISHTKLRMPAEKPIELYERAILSSSDEDALIVDPFCGSGTVAEAAIKHKRRFLAGDIDKQMVRVSQQRIGITVNEDAVDARSVPSCPVFNSVPASPALWGYHPEDIQDWKRA